MNWIHKLFNPHCLHCKNNEEDSRICNNCEYLKLELSKLQSINEKLLNQILEIPQSVKRIESNEAPLPLNTTRFIPWNIKRQELEARDRKTARQQAEELKKNHNKNIEELEKEILEAKVEPLELTNEVVNAE